MEEKSTYGRKDDPTRYFGDVPAGYFETLEDRVMARIHGEEEAGMEPIRLTTPRVSWWRPLAAAACAAGILAFAFFGFQQREPFNIAMDQHAEFERQLAQLSNEELESALLEEDVTVDEITASMDEETLSSLDMDDILSAEEVESLFTGTIASADDQDVITGLESSVLTDWEIEAMDFDMDGIDLSAFGLDSADLQKATDAQEAPATNIDSIN